MRSEHDSFSHLQNLSVKLAEKFRVSSWHQKTAQCFDFKLSRLLLSRALTCWAGSIKRSLNKRQYTKCYNSQVLYKPLLTGCLEQRKVYVLLCHILQLFPAATQFLKRKLRDSSVLICFIQLCFLCISSPSTVLQIYTKKMVAYLLCSQQQQHWAVHSDMLTKDTIKA